MKRVGVNDRFMIDLFQDFISAIPLSMWNEKLLIPAEQCVDNGFSCIQTSYPDPSDATKIEVEDRSTGGDIAPYYIMDRRARSTVSARNDWEHWPTIWFPHTKKKKPPFYRVSPC